MAGSWDGWIGREQHQADRLDAALAARWLATFDLDGAAAPAPGDAMPQGVHFCLCTPDAPTAGLGEDGHPRRDGEGGFLPPVPLPRRMWAGSRIAFHRPIAVGDAIARTSRIAAITEKTGGSGTLVFVEIDHATHAGGALAVEERQTLVYRGTAPADAALTPPVADGVVAFDPAGWDAHRQLVPEARLLFRYSALTFNTHRIHYDWPYARDVERYRGLVVHGPLIASLLLQFAAERLGGNRLARFAFRGLSPAIAGEALHLVMRGAGAGGTVEMAAFAPDGRQVTSAEAELA